MVNIEKTSALVYGEKLDTFEEYFNFLIEWNSKFNLTAIKEKNEVFIKHFIDSAAGADFFETGANVLEVGSGAGFPSVPLKILRDDLTFTLVESTGKKCRFLTALVEKLGIKGVKVINSRAEEAAKKQELRESYDIVCARAVAELNKLLEYCLPFVKVGGKVIAYKGNAEEEVKNSSNAIKILGGKLVDSVKYELPEGMGSHSLVIVEKVKTTPLKYPRSNMNIQKYPL